MDKGDDFVFDVDSDLSASGSDGEFDAETEMLNLNEALDDESVSSGEDYTDDVEIESHSRKRKKKPMRKREKRLKKNKAVELGSKDARKE